MTWGVLVTNKDGDLNVCRECKHSVPPAGSHYSPCNIAKMSQTIGSLLTSVDVGADGHMACGTAKLECHGFDRKDPQPETGAAHA